MNRNQGIGRSTIVLLAAHGLSGGLGVIRGLYIAHFLRPAHYGVWSLMLALLNYANYGDVGVNTGMILRVPRLIGQGRLNEAQRVLRQAYIATLAVCGAGTLVITLISLLPLQFGRFQPGSIRIVAAAVLVLALLNYYHVVARIQGQFGLISLSTVFGAVVGTMGIIVVGLASGGLGVELVALVTVLGSGVAALVLGLVARPALAWPLDWGTLRGLIKVGLPVSLLPIAFTLFQSVDRWVVALLIPAEALGYYGLGTTIGLCLYLLPSTLAVVLFTRQIERFGATGDPRASEPLVSAPLLVSGYSMAFVAGGVALTMPLIIHYLVPAYLPGTRAAIFQVIGNSLLFGVPVASNFIISTGRRGRLFSALGIGIIVEAGLVFLLVRTGWGIDGAALAVLLSDAVYGGSMVFLAGGLLGGTILQQLRRVASCFVPFAICLPVSLYLQTDRLLNGPLWNDLNGLIVRGALYVLVCVPACLVVAWLTGLFLEPVVVNYVRQRLPRVARLALRRGENPQ